MVITEAISVSDLRQQRSDHLGITGSSFSGGALQWLARCKLGAPVAKHGKRWAAERIEFGKGPLQLV
jgi:hypothetical protein